MLHNKTLMLAIRLTSIHRVWHPAAARPEAPALSSLHMTESFSDSGLFCSSLYTGTQRSFQGSFTCCRWLLDRLQVEKEASSFQLMWIRQSGMGQVWVTALSKLTLKSTRAAFVLSIHYEGGAAGQQRLIALRTALLLLALLWNNFTHHQLDFIKTHW